MLPRPTCASCIHYFPESEDIGHCRRHPPTAFKFMVPVMPRPGQLVPPGSPPGAPILGEQLSSSWPPIRASAWCGEHPDFIRWYSESRETIKAELSLNAADAAGEA